MSRVSRQLSCSCVEWARSGVQPCWRCLSSSWATALITEAVSVFLLPERWVEFFMLNAGSLSVVSPVKQYLLWCMLYYVHASYWSTTLYVILGLRVRSIWCIYNSLVRIHFTSTRFLCRDLTIYRNKKSIQVTVASLDQFGKNACKSVLTFIHAPISCWSSCRLDTRHAGRTRSCRSDTGAPLLCGPRTRSPWQLCDSYRLSCSYEVPAWKIS